MVIFVPTTTAKRFRHTRYIGNLPAVDLADFVEEAKIDYAQSGKGEATVVALPKSQISRYESWAGSVATWTRLTVQMFDDTDMPDGGKTIILDNQD